VVLHDIADDPKLVKVSAPALRPKGLLEANLNIGDEVAVPCGVQKLVGKPALQANAYINAHVPTWHHDGDFVDIGQA
jgi:hypothetical protein